MIYNGETYYYEKNTLGDIIAIKDNTGSVVARYEYDAWGNHTVYDEYGIENTTNTFIGNVNPFRYRGYYYDTETGFYYLQTRYYDPTICRFINADKYELIATLSSMPNQLNMYAYCGNNPIMFTDESGQWGLLATMIVGAIIGGVLSGGFAVAEQVDNYGWDTSKWDTNQIILSTLGGVLSGAVAASPLGIGWQIGISLGINVLTSVVTQIDSGQSFDYQEMISQGLIDVFAGLLGGGTLGISTSQFGLLISDYIADKSASVVVFGLFYDITKSSTANMFLVKFFYAIGG